MIEVVGQPLLSPTNDILHMNAKSHLTSSTRNVMNMLWLSKGSHIRIHVFLRFVAKMGDSFFTGNELYARKLQRHLADVLK